MNYTQIAIDGPAGAGKSTIAKEVANALGYVYIDTGAMYRAITLKAIENDMNLEDEAVFRFVKDTVFRFKESHLYMDGTDVSTRVRSNDVSNNVSLVSSYLSVRKQLVEIQQKMAENNNVVMDGRDIGTVVLKQAKFKFFLTASIEERAQRRHIDNQKRGISSSFELLKQEIARRDTFDTTREHSPLKAADDAIIIDTSNMTIKQVVEMITTRIREVE
jgi:cytidylate kinase